MNSKTTVTLALIAFAIFQIARLSIQPSTPEVTFSEYPTWEPKPGSTPLMNVRVIHGVVERAEDTEDGVVEFDILDDADCMHTLVLNGSADQLHVEEYNRIITSHTTNRSWGSIEEVFLGED